MNNLLFIAFFIFLNACSLDIDSNNLNEKNNNNKLTKIIKKSNDVRLMTSGEYEIYINNYIKKSKFPDIN
ncbi:hypothetical protein [Candidatus Pelagibacter sp.]|uniref:hypothetical protein n=1 Tax=Candidatus Pelagibacter sp. TaxID=2024849 RepID=UPI003F87332C